LADSGRNDLWTIGDLLPGETGTIKIMVEVNPSSADDTLLGNVVNMACIEQANSQDIAETSVKGHPENKTGRKK
jgi:hypothetical protein